MKKYLLGLLILGVTVALATTVYADWAEVSESSTRDVEWAGEIKADQSNAKQANDLRLRQLSEQAENLRTTAISAASVSITASAAVEEVSAAAANDDSGAALGTHLLLVDEPGLGGIGSMGDGDADNPPADDPQADNPPADDPPADDPIIIIPRDDPDDIVPGEPGSPGDPDPPPEPVPISRTAF